MSATKYHKLELLIRSRIHNVFHFSLLKPHLGLPPDVIDQIPHEFVGNNTLVTPLVVGVFVGTEPNWKRTGWLGLDWSDTLETNVEKYFKKYLI